jgi:hypothetical protein
MNIVLQTSERTLVSLSSEELAAMTNALNEVCHGLDIPDREFQTRLGESREFLQNVLSDLNNDVHPRCCNYEVLDVSAESNSIMIRSITAHGDPVELGEEKARELAIQLQQAIADVSSASS